MLTPFKIGAKIETPTAMDVLLQRAAVTAGKLINFASRGFTCYLHELNMQLNDIKHSPNSLEYYNVQEIYSQR